jgi:hypothetical protein
LPDRIINLTRSHVEEIKRQELSVQEAYERALTDAKTGYTETDLVMAARVIALFEAVHAWMDAYIYDYSGKRKRRTLSTSQERTLRSTLCYTCGVALALKWPVSEFMACARPEYPHIRGY